MTDDTTTSDDTTDDTTDDDSGDDAELAAIRADPAAAHKTIGALHAESAEYRRKLRKAELELERLRTASLSDQERAVAEAEARGRDSALAEHGRRLLEARVLAAAAGRLLDPRDALRHLELDDELLELGDGELEAELGKRVDELLAAKSYLAASNGGGDDRVGVRSPGPRTAPGGARAADVDGSTWLRKAAKRGK